jgi:ATP-dependent helicase/nuclease subunit A
MFGAAFDGPPSDLARALEALAALVNEDDFAKVMAELGVKRSRLRRLLRHHGGLGGLNQAVLGVLGLGPGDTARTLAAAACADGAVDGDGLRRAAAALDNGTASDRARAATIRAWLDAGPGERTATLAAAYQPLFLKKDGGARANLMTKGAREADAGAEAILIAEQARLAALADRLKGVATAEATSALLTVGTALIEAYEALKAARALLDYDDLILAARRLLQAGGQVSWVHYKLDGGIDHILVDEAQDTSPEQWDVIAALAAEFFAGEGAHDVERTVFAVGDEKQSIYSFQGADPGAFARMRTHFAERVAAAGGDWREADLDLTYRSTWAILQTVDAVFADPAVRDGLTAADQAIRHFSFRDGQAGLVELWPTVVPGEVPETDPWDAPLDHLPAASPPMILAERIAARIQGWLDDGEVLESAGRPIRAGDIMILVRTRTAFAEEMVRCLKRRGIPVAGSDRMMLTQQMAVMDLIAVGGFVLLPDDDLNLAVVLKGPVIGLDEESLFDLAHGRTGTLWGALGSRRDDRPAYAEAHRLLAALREGADFIPPFEFFADLLGRGGGRRRLLARLGPDAGDPIDEFLCLALDFERNHVPSLQGFLHWLGVGETPVKRDLERGRGEVRVMTVHGAKGLQSNIIILPDTCTVPDARLDPRLYWDDDPDRPVVLWPALRENENAHCAALRDDARRRIEREHHRLLYVAMTRARDRLYVGGWETRRGRAAGCWYDAVAAAVGDRGAEVSLESGTTGWRIYQPQTAATDTAAEAPATPVSDHALPAWALTPAPAEAVPPRPLIPSRPDDDEPPVRSPFGDDDGARFKRGRLIHRLLQGLPDLDPGARAGAARAYLARPTHGLGEDQQADIAAETLAVLEHPDFEPLFGPASQAEVPLTGEVAGQVIAAQIDRLLIADDAVWVIDYKTNRPPPTDLGGVAPVYLRQMAAYRAALKRIYTDRPVHCFLLWTDGPRLMALPASLLDPHAP